jgi:hypothetical protein
MSTRTLSIQVKEKEHPGLFRKALFVTNKEVHAKILLFLMALS